MDGAGINWLGKVEAGEKPENPGLNYALHSIWLRHDLATFKGRLEALEARMAQEGIVLTESQLAAMERVREEKEARSETETEHLGYLGA